MYYLYKGPRGTERTNIIMITILSVDLYQYRQVIEFHECSTCTELAERFQI